MKAFDYINKMGSPGPRRFSRLIISPKHIKIQNYKYNKWFSKKPILSDLRNFPPKLVRPESKCTSLGRAMGWVMQALMRCLYALLFLFFIAFLTVSSTLKIGSFNAGMRIRFQPDPLILDCKIRYFYHWIWILLATTDI